MVVSFFRFFLLSLSFISFVLLFLSTLSFNLFFVGLFIASPTIFSTCLSILSLLFLSLRGGDG